METSKQTNEPDAANSMSPRVTFAMPVYNGEPYISQTIESLLSQSFKDFELLITDNASTDETQRICEEFAASDSRVRYVRNEQNLGAAGNYNRGFELSRGEFLKWCAHDDLLSADYLEKTVAALDAHPEAIMAYGWTQMIDTDNNEIVDATPTILENMDSTDSVDRFMHTVKMGGSCGGIFGLFRKSALARSTLHRGYYQSDRALLSELALMGPFAYVEDCTFFNREHETRSMSLDDKAARARWQNAKASGRFAFEQWPLSFHYLQIIARHNGSTGLHRTFPRMLMWLLAPAQAARYILELISAISPKASAAVRRFFIDRGSKSETEIRPAE